VASDLHEVYSPLLSVLCVLIYIELGVLVDGMDADLAAHPQVGPNEWYDRVICVMH